MSVLKLRLLVGRIEGEDGFVVAAAVDESIYDVGGYDVWNPAKVREEWPDEYEWREVVAVLATGSFAPYFDIPEVRALVPSPQVGSDG